MFPFKRQPLIRQYDQLDCGPSALLTVLRCYGGNTTLVRARQLCRTDTQGSTMLDLVRAAERMGFKAWGASGTFADLAKEKMPCIAHVVLENGLQHFLVIYRIRNEKLYVGDPGKGNYRLTASEFEQIWKRHAVILLQPADPLMNEPSRSWLTWIGAYLRRQESWLLQILFTGFIYTALGLLTALFVQALIDRFIPAKNQYDMLYIGIALLALLLLRGVIGYVRDRFLIAANKRLSLAVTDDFLIHLFRLQKPFFDSRKTGDITARINDSLKIHRTSLLLLQSVLLELTLVLGALLFMFYFSTKLGLLMLATAPLYAWALWRKGRLLKQQQMEVMKTHATVESTYIDSIQGIGEIMSYNAARPFTLLNQSLFGLLQTHLERLGLMQAGLTLAVTLLGALISVAVLVLGGLQVIYNELQLGQFMAAYSLLSFILPSIINIVIGFVEFQGADVAAQRLMDLLLVEAETHDKGTCIEHLSVLSIHGLSFAYPKSPSLLQEITMNVPAGRITGLWGHSGAGKSTMVQLLQRKYNPDSGAIDMDGLDIREMDIECVRRIIAVVPQQIKIFNATLSDNILLGRPVADWAQITGRLQEIGMGQFEQRFPQGLLTLLGEEGRKLSGGETQLLALARALYGEPKLLIIDEGFSAIDADLEHLLAEIITRYAREHGVLMITHNLESLRKTDYVYLLQGGKIVQEGAPADLLAKEGLFQQLWLIKNQILFSTMTRTS